MRVLVSPDKFKGSLTAAEVAENVITGLRVSGADADALPLADGGDGSVAAGLSAGMRARRCTVTGATGHPQPTMIAMDGTTAIVELANSCGLQTLPHGRLAPMVASSRGFGEAIGYAVGLGARRLVLALGGSSSTDGGIGMLAALGYTFHGHDGRELAATTNNLGQIASIRAGAVVDLRGIDIEIASDVTNPLLGEQGAAAVFGPQKGANPDQIGQLECGLQTLVCAVRRSFGERTAALASVPGSGAAGGCGFAALMLGGRMRSGAAMFLDLLGFDQRVRGSDLVITGEGSIDEQTLSGKLPAVVLERAHPVPVIAVVGRNGLAPRQAGFAAILAVADRTDADTSTDKPATAYQLRRIGEHIGEHAHRYGVPTS